MSFRRFLAVFWVDFTLQLRRPLFWVAVLLALLTTWGLSSGSMTVSSGSSDVGGTKAHVTSQFAQALQQSVLFILMYGFFFAVACGTPVIRDREEKVGEVLHSTRLTAAEYVWGKFLAPFAAFALAFGLHVLFAMFFNHLLPNADAEKFQGAFALRNYLAPALMFCLPAALFMSGVAFFIGERTQKPILVFLVPVIAWAYIVFFVVAPWMPEELDPSLNRLVMAIDPSGFRWLNEVWLKVDRGVDFYNTASIRADALFLATRLGFAALGLLGVALSQLLISRRLRGAERIKPKRIAAASASHAPDLAPRTALPKLAALGMRQRTAGLWRQTRQIAGAEARNLLFQPGLYLFTPLILVNTVFSAVFARGWLESKILTTSGTFAVSTFEGASFWIVLLLMFYTIESLERERASGLSQIFAASPVSTFAVLAGKAIANSLVGVAVLFGTFLGCVIALAVQGKTPLELQPFLLVWGLLLVPTLLLWTSFVSFVYSLTGNRYGGYAICLTIVALTGLGLGFDKMNWALNWPLWGALQWSDISVFEFDRTALWLNRGSAMTLVVAFLVFAVRFYPRIEADPQRILHRLAPRALLRTGLKAALVLAVPAVLITILAVQTYLGPQGGAVRSRLREYRQKNFITWYEAELPRIAAVDLDVTIDPDHGDFSVRGHYDLINHHAKPMRNFPVTPGLHWRDVSWTLDGHEFQPEDRAGLQVFASPEPLAPGAGVVLGFEYTGRLPMGISRNGGGAAEFVLPSSVVLTSFSSSFAPWIGFAADAGVEDKTRFEPRDYPDDAHVGRTPSGFGTDEAYPTRIRITGPADFEFHSVGRKTADESHGDERSVVWESDFPVTFFNIVGGRWQRRDGAGTSLFYSALHPYNIDEMSQALDASRRYYSEWFYPFPWETLKVSEFAALATYAQGFPTNITFSEGIGFLTESDAKSHAAFLVTAHESAHQWWGNLINPGKLPGGDILSEGAAHFSTILLTEQVLGDQARMETQKRLEEQYGRDRQIDSERPLVKTDGSRAGDGTVTYDKGGWVFTMLQRLMGREANLAGIREFFRIYVNHDDHPVLQDFLATLRPHAPDPAAFDDFAKQWFFEVVMPEYKLEDVTREGSGNRWVATATVRNAGTGRMPIEIAATRAVRFEEQNVEQAALGPALAAADYREARASVTLATGEQQTVRIECDFEPERVVVDPDVRVLQLRRKDNSVYEF